MVTDSYFLKSFVNKLSHRQKKIIVASGSRPKSFTTILRHAKVAPLLMNTKGAIFSRRSFSSRDMNLLFKIGPNDKYTLTSVGKSVKNCIMSGLTKDLL